MAPALSSLGLLPSLARPSFRGWHEKRETVLTGSSSSRGSGCASVAGTSTAISCILRPAVPSSTSRSVGRGIGRSSSGSPLSTNSQIGAVDSSAVVDCNVKRSFKLQLELEESEFPFPAAREKPESWSRAQRALVEGAIDLGLQLDLNLAGDGHTSTTSVSSSRRRAELVEEVRTGAKAGVFYLKNFGVDMEELNQVRKESSLFFALCEEDKEVGKMVGSSHYTAPGYKSTFSTASNTAEAKLQGNAPSFRQTFRFNMSPHQDRGANVWPPILPRFRQVCAEYSDKMVKVVEFVMGLLAEGLGLPPSYITDRYGALFTRALLTHSPPQQLLPGCIAAPAFTPHSDANMFNINVSNGVRGLQYYLDGDWLTMPALLDAALVSLGDDMETISNGRYHSAFHRVLTGPRHRVSLITTVALADDRILAPATELGPARYRSRRRGDRLAETLNQFLTSRRFDRTKAGLLLDPHSHLDKTRNIYDHEGVDYINGHPVLDWGETLTHS